MKIVVGFFIILTFYFVGESISYFIHHFIPGNIIGMVLLFMSLYFKLLSPDSVKDTARGMTQNMTIFFIPASVGIMEYTDLLSQFWISIIVICSISTLLVMATVGWIGQAMSNRKEPKA